MSNSLGHSIQCGVCQATFTRQEHLVRHSRGHTTEKPFECSHCGKAFSRSDALHRHIQSHTEKPVDSNRSSARACESCSAARVRCTRGSPCERCKQRQLGCVYPVSRKRKNCSSLPPLRASPRQERNVNYLYDNARPLDQASTSNELDTTHAAGWLPLPPQLTNTLAPLENDMNITFEADLEPFSLNLNTNSNEWSNGILSVNWLYSQDLALEERQTDGISYSSTGTAPQGSTELEMSFAQPCHISARDGSSLGSTPIDSPASKIKSSTLEGTQKSSPSSSISSDGMYYVEGTVGRAAFHRRISRGNSRMNSTTSEREEVTMTSGFPSISQQVFVSETIYEDFLCKVQAKCDSLGLGPDKATLPTRDEIEQYIQSYFYGFHATYPFLRKDPCQFVSSEGWLLLLAVAAVGSRYSHVGNDERPETCLPYLVDQIVSNRFNEFDSDDNEQPWIPGPDVQEASAVDLITVQAGLLNCLLSLHSGRRNLIRRALDQRYKLIEACDRLSLLPTVDSTAPSRMEAVSSGDIVSRWLDEEARIRTGWMIWMLDTIVLYEFNYLPLLQIGDVKASLPHREEVWDCGTAAMITNEKDRPVTLIDALEMLYLEKKLPPNLGDLATNMLILAICRRTREAGIQSQTKLTFWSPTAQQERHSRHGTQVESWPPDLLSVSKWRNSACDCLDILHWEANATVAHTRGWENPTIFHLHLARVLLLVPIHHIQRLATPPNPDSAGYRNSKYHVVRWAKFDQYKARLSLVHAGALFWYVRRYSSRGFLEPFGVYAATLTIWAYSTYMHQSEAQGVITNAALGNSTPVHGSVQQFERSCGTKRAQNHEGESDGLLTVIQLDRPCDDEIVQIYVRFGPNISARMAGVGEICEPSSPCRILKQGLRLLDAYEIKQSSSYTDNFGISETVNLGWGISRSFSEVLRSLVTAQCSPETDINRAETETPHHVFS